MIPFCFLLSILHAAPWNSLNDPFNLNKNAHTTDPLAYSGIWQNHSFFPSPDSWRFPFYTLLLDRFSDGDPTNNHFNQTFYEVDPTQVNFRHGGDITGLMNRLDYLEHLGIKGIYIAGTPFVNQPWDYHGYNPLDFTLLDPHWGHLTDWRNTIDAIHSKGMYVILDLTISTLGDLLYFDGHMNSSTPFDLDGYPLLYKYHDLIYADFQLNNTIDPQCQLPELLDEFGNTANATLLHGCFDSDFNQFGDIEAFGVYPIWQRQLSKFASVQDRLREWKPSLQPKLVNFACLLLESLDVDGFRVDKATQLTLDFITRVWAPQVRLCAAKLKKYNFFLPGEITTRTPFGALYLGRGKSFVSSPTSQNSIRDTFGLDATAFHYGIYRSLCSFLGLFGNIDSDLGVDFVQAWNFLMDSYDFVNANTGTIDPREMWGIGNQDTFRWPSLRFGTERLQLGMMLTTNFLPGIPLLYYGDEQNLYLHDSRAENYVYGRQSMTSSLAWQLHGCFKGNASYQYFNMPFEQIRVGCRDVTQSLDHFDEASSSFVFLQYLYRLRSMYPVLNDGLRLTTVQNLIWNVTVDAPTYVTNQITIGLWSAVRQYLASQENPFKNSASLIWFLFSNLDYQQTWGKTLDCSASDAVWAPFPSGITIRNIFPPFDYYTVIQGNSNLVCISNVTLSPYGFKAFVPVKDWVAPEPALVGFEPGHDARIEIDSAANLSSVSVKFYFSDVMDCQFLSQSLKVSRGNIRPNSIICTMDFKSYGNHSLSSAWSISATWENIPAGVYTISIGKGSKSVQTGKSLRHEFSASIRFGLKTNPLVFPSQNSISESLQSDDLGIYIRHLAVGSDLFRYSLDYGRTWTEWKEYTDTTRLSGQDIHIVLQYWCKLCGSAAHQTHARLNLAANGNSPIVFPSIKVQGDFNQYGLDTGIANSMLFIGSVWTFPFMWNFPAKIYLDIWGDGKFIYGDVDFDHVLDRLPPSAVDPIFLHIPAPPKEYVGWTLIINETSLEWSLEPRGSWKFSLAIFIILWLLPVCVGTLTVMIYRCVTYAIKINRTGRIFLESNLKKELKKESLISASGGPKSILLATLEYEIPDWRIKVRIGGLGVIAALMSRCINDRNIVWVIPKVGDVAYPEATSAPPLIIKILSKDYRVDVQIHTFENVKFILLDAPIFKERTQNNPYPERMDDLESAIFYSCWNQCIAKILELEPIELYHVNDYHGALAPLYLLPSVIPVVLSLHNAEFQGLFPLRSKDEKAIICGIFNLKEDICQKYIQFGNTFNFLHGISTYIRIHQKGLGAYGVSDLYSNRCLARYPVMWCLSRIDSLPNPNPRDMLDSIPADSLIARHRADSFELTGRHDQKMATQEWANLLPRPNATIIAFVGRWSWQKGIDLIADISPLLLQQFPHVQLICVGPIIDLHGTLAAIKLRHVAHMFPGRIFAKPEFTTVPKFVFEACDFVLIPSRDEPFGLVSVEFGRNGALGVGSFVGGLGSMPGWWYPIESQDSSHLLSQFWNAIETAMKTPVIERIAMRMQSKLQRFPVKIWLKKLSMAYETSLKHSELEFRKRSVIHQKWDKMKTPPTLFLSGLPEFTDQFKGEHISSVGDTIKSIISLKSLPRITPTLFEFSFDADDELGLTNNSDLTLGSPCSKKASSICESDIHEIVLVDWDGTTSISIESVLNQQPVKIRVLEHFRDQDMRVVRFLKENLPKLTARNSVDSLRIDYLLKRGEKLFFSKFRKLNAQRFSQEFGYSEFMFVFLQKGFKSWPFYCIILSIGQFLGLSIFQLALLGHDDGVLRVNEYIANATFIVGSLFWWVLYRKFKAVIALASPFLMYAIAISLYLLGNPMFSTEIKFGFLQTAVYIYTFASASGYLYFTLNFGEECSASTPEALFRGGVMQGARQIWLSLLWYCLKFMDPGSKFVTVMSVLMVLITITCAILLFLGLPECYRATSPSIPFFWRSLFSRKLVIWFLVSELVSAFWLAGLYGRTFKFLWTLPLTLFEIIGMLLFFYVFLWACLLWVLGSQSQTHSWIVSVFSVGLVSPRWAQLFWVTSSLGTSLAWASQAGTFLSLSLFLWLGMLDSLQQIGFGMMLTQTLTRVHVAGCLMNVQVIGSIVLMISRWLNVKASSLFTNVVLLDGSIWFWIVLMIQFLSSFGFLIFFRREQLSRP